MVKIAPSVLSADFSCLEKEIKKVEKAGADLLHLDIMDGHFVPNISFGPPVVEAIKKVTRLPLDVHLMIENPDFYMDAFARAGANIITVHCEACRHLAPTITEIKKKGIKAGVSLNPATPLKEIEYVLHNVDLVLVMSVNPGFSGQKFIPEVLAKIKELDEIIKKRKLKVDLEVDGGINLENAALVKEAGANILVCGSAVYKGDARRVIRALKKL